MSDVLMQAYRFRKLVIAAEGGLIGWFSVANWSDPERNEFRIDRPRDHRDNDLAAARTRNRTFCARRLAVPAYPRAIQADIPSQMA
ncbi:hypothetical protein [Paraburkholderia xenovorans]|uniref:hypothetical protein n=1 Tax=Paraburkholderia xenovorans TaxID=36873 RepID=UPI0038BD33BD